MHRMSSGVVFLCLELKQQKRGLSSQPERTRFTLQQSFTGELFCTLHSPPPSQTRGLCRALVTTTANQSLALGWLPITPILHHDEFWHSARQSKSHGSLLALGTQLCLHTYSMTQYTWPLAVPKENSGNVPHHFDALQSPVMQLLLLHTSRSASTSK